jgi:hypothetical protein
MHAVNNHVLEVVSFLFTKCKNPLIVMYGPPFCSEVLGADHLVCYAMNYNDHTTSEKNSDYFTPPAQVEELPVPLLEKNSDNSDKILYINRVHLYKNGKRCEKKEFSVLLLPPLFLNNQLRWNCDNICYVAKTFNHDGIVIDLSLQSSNVEQKSNIIQELNVFNCTIGSAQTRASLCCAIRRCNMRLVGCFKLCFTFS